MSANGTASSWDIGVDRDRRSSFGTDHIERWGRVVGQIVIVGITSIRTSLKVRRTSGCSRSGGVHDDVGRRAGRRFGARRVGLSRHDCVRTVVEAGAVDGRRSWACGGTGVCTQNGAGGVTRIEGDCRTSFATRNRKARSWRVGDIRPGRLIERSRNRFVRPNRRAVRAEFTIRRRQIRVPNIGQTSGDATFQIPYGVGEAGAVEGHLEVVSTDLSVGVRLAGSSVGQVNCRANDVEVLGLAHLKGERVLRRADRVRIVRDVEVRARNRKAIPIASAEVPRNERGVVSIDGDHIECARRAWRWVLEYRASGSSWGGRIDRHLERGACSRFVTCVVGLGVADVVYALVEVEQVDGCRLGAGTRTGMESDSCGRWAELIARVGERAAATGPGVHEVLDSCGERNDVLLLKLVCLQASRIRVFAEDVIGERSRTHKEGPGEGARHRLSSTDEREIAAIWGDEVRDEFEGAGVRNRSGRRA